MFVVLVEEKEDLLVERKTLFMLWQCAKVWCVWHKDCPGAYKQEDKGFEESADKEIDLWPKTVVLTFLDKSMEFLVGISGRRNIEYGVTSLRMYENCARKGVIQTPMTKKSMT